MSQPLCPPGFPPLPVSGPPGASPTAATATAPAAAGTAELDLSLLWGIRQSDGWDDPQEQDGELSPNAQSAPSSQNGTFNCTRGKAGVRSLELSATGRLMKAPQGGMSETFAEGATVEGASFKWIRGEMLGRGSLGTVFQAMDSRTGQIYAAKEVQINASDESDLKFKASLENEIHICKDLSHPRIVAYYGHDYIASCLYIYLEYMPGGSMAQVLRQFGPFEESLLVVYSREILEGLEYLHTREPPVVHRDIKGGNVLVGLDCRVKLSDFGCSKRTMETMSHTIKGSIPWMAPEVIKSTGYGRMADIWSFGCVAIEMASAKSPWGVFDNPMAAMVRIAMSKEVPPIPESLSAPCVDFIQSCVQRDPTKRPTATTLLQHDLVRDLLADTFR